MRFITKPGRKNNNPKDKILFSVCESCANKEALKLIDWLKWARFKGHIEDLHYPLEKGFLGRNMLKKFLGAGLEKDANGKYIYTLKEIATMFKIEEV